MISRKNKKADINVTLVVILTLALFIAAILSFTIKENKQTEELKTYKYIQEINSMVEKIKFYQASGGNPAELEIKDKDIGKYIEDIKISGDKLILELYEKERVFAWSIPPWKTVKGKLFLSITVPLA